MEKKIVKRTITFTYVIEIDTDDLDVYDKDNTLECDDAAFERAFSEVEELDAQDFEVEMKCFDAEGNEVGEPLENPEDAFAVEKPLKKSEYVCTVEHPYEPRR